MAATDILKRGSNHLHEEQLYRNDGTTPLLLSELVTINCQIVQYRRVLASYNLKPGVVDDEIRQGSSTSILEIEITKELSATFKEGLVTAILNLEETDAEFIVDGEFFDKREIDLFTVEL